MAVFSCKSIAYYILAMVGAIRPSLSVCHKPVFKSRRMNVGSCSFHRLLGQRLEPDFIQQVVGIAPREGITRDYSE